MYHFYAGQIVIFGRQSGQQTRAQVLTVHRKSLTVKTLEPRGKKRIRPTGTVWRVHQSLCLPENSTEIRIGVKRKVSEDSPAKVTKLRRGDRVSFLFQGEHMTGTVLRVNRKTVSVTPDIEDADWNVTYYRVNPLSVQRLRQ